MAQISEPLGDAVAVMKRLHAMTISAISARSFGDALGTILDTAIALSGADFGNVQLYDSNRRQLLLVAHRGFEQDFLDAFAVVHCVHEGRRMKRRTSRKILAELGLLTLSK
jgi:hypothetical protein